VPTKIFVIWFGLLGTLVAQASRQEPQVKVNVLNVCSPSAAEQQEIVSALSRVPKQPLFSPDFEVDRGRSSMEEHPNFLQPGQSTASSGPATANWVRIRREFSVQALFSTVQYSFSLDPSNMTETLVFHVRDPKDLLELTIEDSASAVATSKDMLSTNTPASRIKLERFGKSSIVLARCNAAQDGTPLDQSAYEPLFQSASKVVDNYRELLGARTTVPDELARVAGMAQRRAPPKSAPKKGPTQNK
jgi:hypothetical protein